jgi:quercetin dioxygenase-like cupin family protein
MQAGDALPDFPEPPRAPEVPEWPRPSSPPRVVEPGLVALLDAVANDGPQHARPEASRRGLLERIARSAEASRGLFTVRRHHATTSVPTPGVQVSLLYQAKAAALRRGEPRMACWIELAPGSRWRGAWPAAGLQRDWLVVRGCVRVGETLLNPLDYHVLPAGIGVEEISTEVGATLYLREAPRVIAAVAAEMPETAAHAEGQWADFAPGIRRRLLWVRGAEAAMLYHALPGAAVPRHAHGHDEECLMLEGELFVDEVLLRAAEYQLAPAGTQHGGLSTDTGVVIYAHGDLELALMDP